MFKKLAICLKSISLSLLCLFAQANLYAQASENFIENPSFEELRSNNKKVKNWIFPNDLAIKPTKSNPHEGLWCLSFYANSGSFSSVRFDPVKYENTWEYIPVKEGEEYRLTYWLRADKAQTNVYPSLTWVTSSGNKSFSRLEANIASITTKWTMTTVDFTVPAGAERLGVSYRVHKEYNGGYIYIDDITLIKIGEGSGVVRYPAPTDLRTKSYQREIELSWNKGLVDGVSWEIRLNGSQIIQSNKPSYCFTELNPSQEYKIELRCRKGNLVSDFTSPIFVRTKQFTAGRDELGRVPYIRTIDEYGMCPQTIDLYFINLYNVDAKIKYLFDGVEIKPNGKQLTFPKKGKHHLRVDIEEDQEHSWLLDYKLTIR